MMIGVPTFVLRLLMWLCGGRHILFTQQGEWGSWQRRIGPGALVLTHYQRSNGDTEYWFRIFWRRYGEPSTVAHLLEEIHLY